jgi:hypothetical protein
MITAGAAAVMNTIVELFYGKTSAGAALLLFLSPSFPPLSSDPLIFRIFQYALSRTGSRIKQAWRRKFLQSFPSEDEKVSLDSYARITK